jgi:hypothetical protein
MIPDRPMIRCGFGLGNRVAAIAHALSMTNKIAFVWRQNWQCPATHDQIFPNGVQGVEFVADAPMRYATKIQGVPLHHYREWADRKAMRKSYSVVIAAMTGSPSFSPDCGILGRFHRFPINISTDTETLAEGALWHKAKTAFVLADCHRREIAKSLAKRGIAAVFPNGPEMANERDRTPEKMIEFCSDWKTLLASRHVITTGGVSSLMYPYAAFQSAS